MTNIPFSCIVQIKLARHPDPHLASRQLDNSPNPSTTRIIRIIPGEHPETVWPRGVDLPRQMCNRLKMLFMMQQRRRGERSSSLPGSGGSSRSSYPSIQANCDPLDRFFTRVSGFSHLSDHPRRPMRPGSINSHRPSIKIDRAGREKRPYKLGECGTRGNWQPNLANSPLFNPPGEAEVDLRM